MTPEQQESLNKSLDKEKADQDNTSQKDIEDPHAYAEDLDHGDDGLDHTKDDHE